MDVNQWTLRLRCHLLPNANKMCLILKFIISKQCKAFGAFAVFCSMEIAGRRKLTLFSENCNSLCRPFNFTMLYDASTAHTLHVFMLRKINFVHLYFAKHKIFFGCKSCWKNKSCWKQVDVILEKPSRRVHFCLKMKSILVTLYRPVYVIQTRTEMHKIAVSLLVALPRISHLLFARTLYCLEPGSMRFLLS